MSRSLTILVIDRSAVYRQGFVGFCSGLHKWKVVTAPGMSVALKKIQVHPPDVILLHGNLPHEEVDWFLQPPQTADIPVILCFEEEGRVTDSFLQFLPRLPLGRLKKPSMSSGRDMTRFLKQVAELFRTAPPRQCMTREKPAMKGETSGLAWGKSGPIIAIGASAGGTEAIAEILRTLPGDTPPILIVQHLPERFTASFAQRLNAACRIEVREGADGDVLHPGLALVAPGGRHMRLKREGGRFLIRLDLEPAGARHRPSVDVLFQSVAVTAEKNAIGVILTGMGKDGGVGLGEMRRTGAFTMAQDEASSMVYGMPGEAVRQGAVDAILPLNRIAEAIMEASRAQKTEENLPIVLR